MVETPLTTATPSFEGVAPVIEGGSVREGDQGSGAENLKIIEREKYQY